MNNDCKFCNFPYKSIESSTGSIMFLETDKDNFFTYLHVLTKNEGPKDFKIKYCPICGKNLEQRREDIT